MARHSMHAFPTVCLHASLLHHGPMRLTDSYAPSRLSAPGVACPGGKCLIERLVICAVCEDI